MQLSSEFGKNIKISVFGQSHSQAIGCVIDGLPTGERIDLDKVEQLMRRRAPGRNNFSTQRREADTPQIVSGLVDGVTCGAPLCCIISNTDVRSADYEEQKRIPRPSHADYPAYVKYGGHNDVRGGGHFSGRLTAPLCFAGALCMQILERKGIYVGAHIVSIGSENDVLFDAAAVTGDELAAVSNKEFAVINDEAGERMKAQIEAARMDCDSVGGVIECAVTGLAAGIGDPMFDGLENRISAAIFGIPAVRGIEFGAGFAAAKMRGSEHNDPYCIDKGTVRAKSNNHGGILGGISSGMPVIFRIAVKPTPSIGKEQMSVDLVSGKEAALVIKGRHDPCIVPRAVPVVQAVTAAVMLDLLMDFGGSAQ